MPTESPASQPDSAAPKPRRFEDQIRDACRIRHYSMRTEEAYWTEWARAMGASHNDG